MYLESVKHPVG